MPLLQLPPLLVIFWIVPNPCFPVKDRYQVELLANLDKVPESGALVIVAFPKPKGGSGFPARVFAVLP